MSEGIFSNNREDRGRKSPVFGHALAAGIALFFLAVIALSIYELDFWKSYFFADSKLVNAGCTYQAVITDTKEYPSAAFQSAPRTPVVVPHFGRTLFNSTPKAGQTAHLRYQCPVSLSGVDASAGAINLHLGWIVGDYTEVTVNGALRSTFPGTDKPVISLTSPDFSKGTVDLAIWTRATENSFIGLLGKAPVAIAEGLRKNNKIFGLETSLQKTRSLYNLLPVLTLGLVLAFGWWSGIRSRLLVTTLFYFLMISCRYMLHFVEEIAPWDPSQTYALEQTFHAGTFLSFGLFSMEFLGIGVRWINRGLIATSLLVAVEFLTIYWIPNEGLRFKVDIALEQAHHIGFFAMTLSLLYFGALKLRHPDPDPARHQVNQLFWRATILFLLLGAVDYFLIKFGSEVRLTKKIDLVMPLFIGGVVLYALALTERRLTVEREHRAKVESEIAIAAALQNVIVPHQLSGTAQRWRYRISLRPHEALSGDWVKWHDGDNKALFALGDVVGKGISAALTHSGIASIWDVQTRLWENSRIPMHEVIDAINRTMFKLYNGAMNTTFAIAEVHPDGKVDLAAAGHFWLHLSDTGCKPIVAQSSSPLGIRADIKINMTSIELKPGDWLVSFSDGVIEGNRAVKKFLTAVASQTSGLSAETIRNLLIETGKATVKEDDATVLILRYDADA
ncbi:MAG: hypothetical protein RIQ81_711 [Pseudomonadota bacterium]|jgi:serine phosphatase RsbU (regulator of sigma subunit)